MHRLILAVVQRPVVTMMHANTVLNFWFRKLSLILAILSSNLSFSRFHSVNSARNWSKISLSSSYLVLIISTLLHNLLISGSQVEF